MNLIVLPPVRKRIVIAMTTVALTQTDRNAATGLAHPLEHARSGAATSKPGAASKALA